MQLLGCSICLPTCCYTVAGVLSGGCLCVSMQLLGCFEFLDTCCYATVFSMFENVIS